MTEETTKSRKSSGRVTLDDVAKLVGVGKMTVSRALRTPEIVSEQVRKKIEQAVQQLGYVPNLSARQLASATSQNLVIVTSSITSRENALILNALRQTIRDLSLNMLILLADGNWLNELINHAPQAIILLNFDCPPDAATWIKNSDIPVIEIGAKKATPLGCNVCVDSRVAMKMMITFLLEKGYTEIGLLSSNQELSIFQQYLASWHTTLLHQHINPQLIYHSADEISFSAGAKLFSDALLIWGKVDALVFLSDELACGALYEAQRRHINVPQDLAIVSLGGLDVGSVSYPRLTTISIAYEKMGQLAGQQLKKLLAGMPTDSVIEVPCYLEKRDSA